MNEKLIQLRGNRSQEEVAKALGISVSALSMYEQGNGRLGFDPWVGKIPWRREGQPTPVFLPRKSHG